MLEKDVNLVRKIAWNFAKKFPGAEFDDLFSEACIAYLEAESEFNVDTAKRSTFMWHAVSNHLRNVVMKQSIRMRYHSTVSIDELDMRVSGTSVNPEMALIRKEEWESFIEHLSDPAQTICKIILEDMSTFLPLDAPKKCRGAIKNTMRDMGYTWSSIWDGYNEIRSALSN